MRQQVSSKSLMSSRLFQNAEDHRNNRERSENSIWQFLIKKVKGLSELFCFGQTLFQVLYPFFFSQFDA